MSLALLQGYSSAEDVGDEDGRGAASPSSSLEGEGDGVEEANDDDDGGVFAHRNRPSWGPAQPSLSPSSLPSAFDAFAEVAGPPRFLNNAVGVAVEPEEAPGRRGRNKVRDRKEPPAGAVVEAKAQLVGIRDRVRSDIEGSGPPSIESVSSIAGEGKRVVSASNPEAKDAAELLRMCLQCGIPKTYSHARGIVCPVCGDRPLPDPTKEPEKKKGSTIKDKEKSKRMKGQSSHSTWKSETEMHLRQQYD